MGRVEVVYTFQAHELWVTPDCLGQSFTAKIGDYEAEVLLPENPNDFVPMDEPETIRIPSVSNINGYFGGRGVIVQVHLIQVRVRFESDLHGSQKPSNDSNETEREKFADSATIEMRRGVEVAEEVMYKALQWLKAETRQPWLGIGAEQASQYGRRHIYCADTGTRLISEGPINVATMHSDLLAADSEQLRRCMEQALSGNVPSVADLLLADAGVLLDSNVHDQGRVILAAATACEVRVKQAIKRVAMSGALAAIELLLKRQSSLGPLLDSVMQAASGVSLKTVNRALFDRIEELVRLRNKVIHAGYSVSSLEARQALAAARELTEWLDSLPKA